MHLCILIYVWMHAFVMFICICLCIFVNVCMFVYMCVYVYVYVWIDIYTHTNFIIRLTVQYLLTFHSSLPYYNSICWCWTASRNIYFELTQEDFLSFSQNTFVYCICILYPFYPTQINYIATYICSKHPLLITITCAYKGKVETHVLLTKNE